MASFDDSPISQWLLDTLSDSIHNSLQQFMLAVDQCHAEFRTPIPHRDGSSVFIYPPPGFEPLGPRSDNVLLHSMKFDVPRFDGSNPTDWLFRIQAYFDYYGTPEETRLQIVAFHLEGCAASWFQWTM